MEKAQILAKKKLVDELKEKMSSAKSVIFVDFRGLTVADDTRLRKLCREKGVHYKVVKNTLAQRAVKDLGWAGLDDIFQGPTAVAFAEDDPVLPAKVIKSFTDETPVIKIKGGVLEGQRLSEDRITFLATLPAKEVLLAQTAGAFRAPLTSFVTVLNAPLAALVRAINALREKKATEAV